MIRETASEKQLMPGINAATRREFDDLDLTLQDPCGCSCADRRLRTKPDISPEQLARARENGPKFRWATADEG